MRTKLVTDGVTLRPMASKALGQLLDPHLVEGHSVLNEGLVADRGSARGNRRRIHVEWPTHAVAARR